MSQGLSQVVRRLDHVFTSIEVCAGAGGQAIGLHRAGFRHLALVEIDRHAAETLRVNGSSKKWWPKRAVFEESLIGWKPPMGIGEVTLVAGGVPCPPFSIAGKQLGASDERDLFPAILDLVTQVRPKVVMIENVRGLLGKRFDSYRADILQRLKHMGYLGEWELLEAHDYGVPQLRPRSVLIAAEPDIWRCFKWPVATDRRVSVGETLEESMASAGWSGATEWARAADEIAPTLVGGSKKHGGADLGPTRARKEWLDRLGVDGRGLANEPPTPNHVGPPRLTVEMAALIQGFPASWEFSGGKTARYRQIGNAFPPPVAEALGRSIRAAIEDSSA